MTGRLALLVLLVASACAPAAPAAPAGLVLAESQELVVATAADGYRVDANRANVGMYPLNANIYDTLIRVSPTYQIEPGLATKWEFHPPNTYRFTLREGVRFHDGTAFTAKDVKFTIDRQAKAGGGTVGVDERSAVVVDDRTIDITPKSTNLRAVQQLGHPSWSIVKEGSDPATKPVGTGPFRFVTYEKGERIVVEANDAYWSGKPTLRKITFRFIPDANTRVLALQAGEVQISDLPRESAKAVTTGDLALATSNVGAYEALYVTIHGKPGFDIGADRAVREALAYAIDKRSVVENVWQGNAEVLQTMIPPAILGPASSEVRGTTRDVARARKVLDEAGWKPGDDGIRAKDGRRLSLAMIVGFPNADIHKPMPEFAQAQLREIGVELRIVITPDTATYEARLKTGEGDLWAEAGNQNDGNPCFLPDLLFTTPPADAKPDQYLYGRLFAPGAKFDAAIQRCRSSTKIEDVQRAAGEAMRILVDEERVVIPLAGTYRLYGVNKKVLDFVAHPSGVQQRWNSVRLAR